ncbi:hypothetical protein DCAR_0934396 [Daucus carota subsp. sativus]|uniref:Uncharacterized protein n=1 Tax=Daucus carota subsp. sativus TaxID=79200 RepID=A0A175YAQ2_DAUCS|nr:hypothetical protein DCAR_0934396 [Daucus carota subsp. sativus]
MLEKVGEEEAVKEKNEVIIQDLMILYLLSEHQDTDENLLLMRLLIRVKLTDLLKKPSMQKLRGRKLL